MSSREVFSLHRAIRDDIQDLVTRRPLPGPGLPQVDPFLFLNHHGPQTYPADNHGLPFGPHPHRGFETVTFILSGSLAHHDSGSGASVVEAGGVQWMTAGSGLVHAELSPEAFKRSGGPLEILQLWVNLPARLKMSDPAYVPVSAADILTESLGDGVAMEVVSGIDGAPVRSLTDVMLATVSMEPDGHASLPAPRGRNVLFYTIEGSAEIGGSTVPEHTLAVLGDGDRVEVASEGGARILYGHADPIGEPVAARGPFVMNTDAEIAEAIRDYQAGRFGGL